MGSHLSTAAATFDDFRGPTQDWAHTFTTTGVPDSIGHTPDLTLLIFQGSQGLGSHLTCFHFCTSKIDLYPDPLLI